MKANLNWMGQLMKHLRFKGSLADGGKELSSPIVTVPDDVMSVFRSAFSGYGKVIFFDLETTGLVPTQDLITQVSAVSIQLRDGKLETFNSYVRLPGDEKIPENITSLTGISDELLLEKGKPEEEALRSFGEWIGDGKTIFAGHNIQFDLCFLLEGLKRQGDPCADALGRVQSADYFDTLTVYKDRRPSPHNLSASLQAYGLEYKSGHHALEDAGGALALAYFMGCEKRNLEGYINRFGINPKYGLTGYEIGRVQYYQQEGIMTFGEADPLMKGKTI